MKLTRRGFLVATAIVAVPITPLRAGAAAPGPQVIGELWGMPYVASGALGNLPKTRGNR